MSLDLNLSAAPFYDDFDSTKGYNKVLFRPGVAVQARELTTLQSILQNQISDFGHQVYVDGTIIQGCALTFDSNYNYVKVNDNYVNNYILTVSNLVGLNAVNQNGLKATIVNSLFGFQSNYVANNAANSQLNTIYVKYLNSSFYSNGVQQQLFDPNDTISLSDNLGNQLGQITVANSATVPIGTGYAATVADGIIFQNGYFVYVTPQTTIVTNYNNKPDGVSIGFVTSETIVTPNIDPSLYDNAYGSSNYNAPGAYRLKLSASLVTRSTNTSSNTETFFSITDFVQGQPAVVNTATEYSALGQSLAQYRFEETGNYSINPFPVSTIDLTNGNSGLSFLNLKVGPGLGYVKGYRIEFVNNLYTPIRKGIDFVTTLSENVSVAAGNYVYADELSGEFDCTTLVQVELHATAKQSITNRTFTSSSHSATDVIGYAFVKSVEYNSNQESTPLGSYRIYLFNVAMNTGYSFNQVKSIMWWDGSNVRGVADVMLDTNGNAVLQETSLNKLVYNIGPHAVKQTNNSFYTYKNKVISSTFTTNGVLTFSSSPDLFPYGGNLSFVESTDFLIFPTANLQTTNKSGTIVSSGNVVTGTSTFFANDFIVGDYVVASSQIRRITGITSNTSLNIDASFSANLGGVNYAKIFPAGGIINTEANNRIISISGNTATFSMNETFTSNSIGATVYFNGYKTSGSPISKQINKNVYVKINCSNNAANSVGPWCLGLPDVLDITGIYINYDGSYNITGTNFVNQFLLDNGQRDSFYNLSYLKINPVIHPNINASATIVVVCDTFTYNTSSGKGYFTVSSYPIDDANTANNIAIQTPQIPIYSATDGSQIDLRDAVDFRPICVNTAIVTNNISTATINPSANIAFSNNNSYIVSLNSNFQVDVQNYLGRTDILSVSPQGTLQVTEGSPSVNPVAPQDLPGSMTLATINIPPYPSLSPANAANYSRFDYAITINPVQVRRYTMKDIGSLDSRIGALEYYTSLSQLEVSANNLLITSNSGVNRFKNGYVVDNFDNFGVSDTVDQTFNIAIDSANSQMVPPFTLNAFDLQLSGNSTNVQSMGELTSLSYTEIPYINQPFASQYRNCIQSTLYTWQGAMALSPSADVTPDYSSNPSLVSVNLDLASNWVNLSNAWGTQWGSWQDISTATSSSSNSSAVTTTTSTTQSQTGTQLSVSTYNTSQTLGTFITSLGVSPYVRANAVKFLATGMKPNTIVYAYFDDTPVSQYCMQTDSNYNVTSSTLKTDSNGNIHGIFSIPSSTFNVGNLTFKLVDVSSLITGSNDITTISSSVYTASDISASTATVTLNTRQATVDPVGVSDTRVLTNSTTTAIVQPVASDTGQQNTTPPANTDPSNTGFYLIGTTLYYSNGQVAIADAYAGNAPDRWAGGESDGGNSEDPIGQSFQISEPTNGVPGIYISSVDLYFQSKDATQGVEVQIRTMDNGFPTPLIVPFSDVIVPSSSINISQNASVATRIAFNSPVFLQTNQSYFLCIKPIGGNPNYTVWTGVISGTDILTNSPIYAINSSGVLFVSSSNITWSPYQNESLKFTLYRSNFNQIGNLIYTNKDYEFLTYDSIKNNFIISEQVVLSNTSINQAVLTISSVSGTVSNGNVWQSNGTSNTATGYAYFSNSTVIKISNSIGSFIVGNTINFSTGNALISTVNQNVVTNSTNNVTVPDGSYYSTNTRIYVSQNTQINTVVGTIVSITGNVLTLSTNVGFTDTFANIGTIRGNTNLSATLYQINSNNQIILTNSNANSTLNFANNKGQKLIGLTSKASANIQNVFDFYYDTISPQLQTLTPIGTGLSATFTGISNSYVTDTTSKVIYIGLNNTLKDNERLLLSKSNEQILGTGKSIIINLQATSANTKLSPIVDSIQQNVTLIGNQIVPQNSLTGKTLFVSNVTLTNTSVGTTIYQGNNSGIIAFSNNSVFQIINMTGNVTVGTANGFNITATKRFSEETGITFGPARYISQKVVLSDGQLAEDMNVYLTVYRPQNTGVLVYAKIINPQDSTPYYSSVWTQMYESSNTSGIYSSSTNENDLIEAEYLMPYTTIGQTNSASSSNSSANITVSSIINTGVSNGNYVYLNDLVSGAFTVAQVVGLANDNQTITLSSNAATTSSNVEFGIINNLININGAFKYTNNSGVVRYMVNNYIFNTYNTFAIKIVPVTTNRNIIPKVSDMRAIALQV
jgi:hypothetical protein